MRSRIYLNNNEDTHYPLLDAGTGIPNNMLAGISVLADGGATVYLSLISSTPFDVSLVFSCGDTRYAYCTWDHKGHPAAPIKRIDDDKRIGWVTFGSGTDATFNSSGRFDLDPSCVIQQVTSTSSRVNEDTFETPDVLNISVGGDFVYTDGMEYVGTINESMLDARNRDLYGSLTSINNDIAPLTNDVLDKNKTRQDIPGGNTTTSSDGSRCVYIKLPEGSFYVTSTTEGLGSVKDPYKDEYIRNIIITIKQKPETSSVYGQDSPYACKFRDPVLDGIAITNPSEDPVELPADIVVKKYKEFVYDQYNISSPIDDTVVINTQDGPETYAKTSRVRFTESMEPGFTVTYDDGDVEVFRPDGSNSGIYYTE